MSLSPAIKIPGHSGCEIEVLLNPVTHFEESVRKLTTQKSYAARLLRQAEKQRQFYKDNVLQDIYTPNISNIYSDSITSYVEMEYAHSHDFIEFFSTCRIDEIYWFCENIVQVVEQFISRSTLVVPISDIFESKITDLCEKISVHPLLSENESSYICNLLSSQIPVLGKLKKLPVGECHGDLTLSNILFKRLPKRQIVLIDFLDSFIETPLQDVVKLRQDTKYFWSTGLVEHRKFDRVRLGRIFQYIDHYISQYFAKYDFYRECYPTLQLINLARILPYSTDTLTCARLISMINRLLEEYKYALDYTCSR